MREQQQVLSRAKPLKRREADVNQVPDAAALHDGMRGLLFNEAAAQVVDHAVAEFWASTTANRTMSKISRTDEPICKIWKGLSMPSKTGP